MVVPALRPTPCLSVARCEVIKTGEVAVYGLATSLSQDALPLSHNIGMINWEINATVVRVDVYPDGKIVYADNYGRGGIVPSFLYSFV